MVVMKGSLLAKARFQKTYWRAFSTAIRTNSFLLPALFICSAPFLAHAEVVISEIQYNPQGSDSGREWIELYNSGASDVAMVGGTVKGSWRISDGSNHTLTDPAGGVGRGSLIIPAGGYLIIANDPTDFISGENAGGTYSVAKSAINLNNIGASISLTDGSGATLDSASYTNGQGGNDDGTSLQRQESGSWIAGLPTPGAANTNTASVAPAGLDPSDQTASSTSPATTNGRSQTTKATQSSYVPPPKPSLYADAGDDRTIIVGADVEFDGEAYDKDQNMLDDTTTRFMWNFGDGSAAEGPSVEHHFDYPGQYVVVLSIANLKTSVASQIIVTAQPAALSFTTLPDGGVAIQDLAGHDLDLSGWIVRESAEPFAAQFILPHHTRILSGGTMHISVDVLKFHATADTSLDYPNGTVALGAGQTSASAAQASPDRAAATSSPAFAGRSVVAVPERSAGNTRNSPDTLRASPDAATAEGTGSETAIGQDVATSSQTALAGQAAAALPAHASKWWWIGAVFLTLIGGGAMYFARDAGKNDWDIVEQKD